MHPFFCFAEDWTNIPVLPSERQLSVSIDGNRFSVAEALDKLKRPLPVLSRLGKRINVSPPDEVFNYAVDLRKISDRDPENVRLLQSSAIKVKRNVVVSGVAFESAKVVNGCVVAPRFIIDVQEVLSTYASKQCLSENGREILACQSVCINTGYTIAVPKTCHPFYVDCCGTPNAIRCDESTESYQVRDVCDDILYPKQFCFIFIFFVLEYNCDTAAI